jgi:glycosyltransferase involved in cell wall biosynthesis
VLRESLACGTPFVSTNVGSIAEIADTAYSILVPAGDCDALCEAIQEILGDSYAKAARDYQPQSWSNSAAELCELLQSLPVNESRKVQEPVELSPI